MPFASKRQQRYFYANREKLERQGVDVDEWSEETDYKNLPEKKTAMFVQTRPPMNSARPADLVDAGPGHAPTAAQRGAVPGQMSGVKGASWFAPIKVGDLIPGGLADWRPDSDFDSVELAKGQAVEMEHTDDPKKAREIAKDHLVEDPRYYVALEVMEDHLEDTEKKASDRSRFVAYCLRKGLEKGSLAPR